VSASGVGSSPWRRQWRGAAGTTARDGVGERGEQGGLEYNRARVMAGDEGRASVVLRRLDRRAYGRCSGRTGGPPRARREYGGVAGAVRGVLGQSERRELWTSGSARTRAEGSSGRCAGHSRRGSADVGRRRAARGHAMSRCAGARPK
jgi:hypothetical protein